MKVNKNDICTLIVFFDIYSTSDVGATFVNFQPIRKFPKTVTLISELDLLVNENVVNK